MLTITVAMKTIGKIQNHSLINCIWHCINSNTNTSLLGTTVFRSKFFQIPRASLINSVAHHSKLLTY